jgi:hypothetical protein
MSSELNENETIDGQRQEQAPIPQEAVQNEPELKDDDVVNAESSQCSSRRRRREVVCVVIILATVIAATIVGVVVAVNNAAHRTNAYLNGGNASAVSADARTEFTLPVPPEPILISDQQELDMIITELSRNNLLSDKASILPTTVAAVGAANTDDADPYVQAAAWITSVDTRNVQQDVMARFVLATIYYINAGKSWKNLTNWMLGTAYHCDWYGVTCCEELFGSVVCQLDSFGQIVELDFYRNNLTGPIPTSVVVLPYLHALYLNENSLTGSVPAIELASMTNLGKFYAQYNYLNGTLPDTLSVSTSIGKLSPSFIRMHLKNNRPFPFIKS